MFNGVIFDLAEPYIPQKMPWQPWGQVDKCWIHLASGGLGLMKFGI